MPDRQRRCAAAGAARVRGVRHLLHGAADARGVQRALARDGRGLGSRRHVLGVAAQHQRGRSRRHRRHPDARGHGGDGAGASVLEVERFAASPEGQEFGHDFDTGSCEVASATARRVGLGPGVARALKESVEWWNGEGPPDGLKGEEIALPAPDRARRRRRRSVRRPGRHRGRGGGAAEPAPVASSTPRSSRPSPRTQMSCSPTARIGDPRERLLEVEPEPGQRDRRDRSWAA